MHKYSKAKIIAICLLGGTGTVLPAVSYTANAPRTKPIVFVDTLLKAPPKLAVLSPEVKSVAASMRVPTAVIRTPPAKRTLTKPKEETAPQQLSVCRRHTLVQGGAPDSSQVIACERSVDVLENVRVADGSQLVLEPPSAAPQLNPPRADDGPGQPEN